MTVLPFLDIKATPVRSIDSPRLSRVLSLPYVSEGNLQQQASEQASALPVGRSSKFSSSLRARSPKIKIVARSDEALKQLPHAKTDGARAHAVVWKPLVRDLPDYDYVWEPVQREDIRHHYDDYTAPCRSIASRPHESDRMTTMFQSEDGNYHNYKRTQAMQQRKRLQDHVRYTIYPYSYAEERELYNKGIRSTLKEQIEQKARIDKSEFEVNSRAAGLAIAEDRHHVEQDKQRKIDRARISSHFAHTNKELMQNKWEYDQWNRVHQWHVERTMLADNPINWSQTLT